MVDLIQFLGYSVLIFLAGIAIGKHNG